MKIKRIILENGAECELHPTTLAASCEGCIFEEGLGDICSIERLDCEGVVIVKVESTKDKLLNAIDKEIESKDCQIESLRQTRLEGNIRIVELISEIEGLRRAKAIIKEVLK